MPKGLISELKSQTGAETIPRPAPQQRTAQQPRRGEPDVPHLAKLPDPGEGFSAHPVPVKETPERQATLFLNALYKPGECVNVMLKSYTKTKKDVALKRCPVGRGLTCGWCFMLASRVFTYTSKQLALAGSHEGCDCVAFPGVKGVTRVEGYDPDAKQERWGRCVAAVDNESLTRRARARWDAKTPDEKSETMQRIADRPSSTSDDADFRVYRTHMSILEACKEAERRNLGWVRHGEPGKVTLELGAEPMPKEKKTAEWLAGNGFDVHFRKTRDADGLKTSDVLIGGPGGEAWEFKRPEGSGKRNISNQFNEARGQADKLVIDVSKSPFDIEYIEAEALRQLELRDDFSEVILVNESYMRRLIKSKKR